MVVVHCYLNNHSSHMFDKRIAFLKSRFGENCFWREKMTFVRYRHDKYFVAAYGSILERVRKGVILTR